MKSRDTIDEQIALLEADTSEDAKTLRELFETLKNALNSETAEDKSETDTQEKAKADETEAPDLDELLSNIENEIAKIEKDKAENTAQLREAFETIKESLSEKQPSKNSETAK